MPIFVERIDDEEDGGGDDNAVDDDEDVDGFDDGEDVDGFDDDDGRVNGQQVSVTGRTFKSPQVSSSSVTQSGNTNVTQETPHEKH